MFGFVLLLAFVCIIFICKTIHALFTVRKHLLLEDFVKSKQNNYELFEKLKQTSEIKVTLKEIL